MTGGESNFASRCCHGVRVLESALRKLGEVRGLGSFGLLQDGVAAVLLHDLGVVIEGRMVIFAATRFLRANIWVSRGSN
jgi:hypothetical protein